MRIRCSICGKGISSEVPSGTVIRGWIECLECIEKQEVKTFKQWMEEYRQGLIDLDTWLMNYRSMIEV